MHNYGNFNLIHLQFCYQPLGKYLIVPRNPSIRDFSKIQALNIRGNLKCKHSWHAGVCGIYLKLSTSECPLTCKKVSLQNSAGEMLSLVQWTSILQPLQWFPHLTHKVNSTKVKTIIHKTIIFFTEMCCIAI